MNRFIRIAQWLFALGLLSSGLAADSFESRFANPPADARIHQIIHGWPEQPQAQDHRIARLRQQGFGGVVCNVSFDQYLESDVKWQAFVRAVKEAKQAGMALWLYDERGYPSGNAGGITMRGHPEWEARGLLIADTNCVAGDVTLKSPPGRLWLAAAYPLREGVLDLARKVDLSGQIRDGELRWQAPTGRWQVLLGTEDRLYEGTHADGNLWSKMPYINLLQAEPTARFLDVTHDAYANRLGSDLGRFFLGTFTDEPSLMSFFLKPMPYRSLPWSPNLPEEFKKRRGYALDASSIPGLVTDAGPGTAKLRHDFWLTVGELVSENFFGQIQSRCRRYGLPSGGHLLLEESIAGHVALYGDFFRCIRRLDAPSLDCLSSLPPEVPWHSARLLASAAELEGHSLVMCETSDHVQRYRPAGDQRPKREVTEAEIRGTCNRLMVSGVNDITSYYSWAGLSDDSLRRLNEWVGRCCAALRGGHQVADIALLYPSETLWTRFTPSRHWTKESSAANRVEKLYVGAANSLFAAARDFTFVDSRALAEAKVESGALVHGSLRWRVVVLPGVDTLPLAAWENIARFVRGGGVLIALASLPANSESEFPSPKVGAIAQELFAQVLAETQPRKEPWSHVNNSGGAAIFLPGGSEGLLPLVLNGVLEPDVEVSGMRPPIRATHRRLEDRDVYFVINDSGKPWAGELTFATQGEGERWDLATGQRAKISTNIPIGVSLAPYEGVLFRFAQERVPKRMTAVGGPLPGLSLRPAARVEPTSPHGQFVRAGLTAASAEERPGYPVWQAAATLTKGNVDTHLFVQFHYDQPQDLSDVDCLAMETWVPAGQKTASQILVILHEEGGGDFVASTGRLLSEPGRERSFLPLNRLELAGWSRDKDADGALDLKRVSDIRIGWGGYYGSEGEKVQFSVALPQLGFTPKAGRNKVTR